MKKTRILFADDEASSDAERYRRRLAETGRIDCKLIAPPPLDALDVQLHEEWDLYLIDYDLTLKQADGSVVPYQGNTLASEIRTRVTDRPIVLITRGSVLEDLDPTRRRQLTERLVHCDALILKSELDEALDNSVQFLVSLAEGFHSLREFGTKDWGALGAAMGASDSDMELLRSAGPPLKNGEWIVTGAANWIRNVVIEYPGILYDPVHAGTLLGISVTAFRDRKLQRVMEDARYTGVFAPPEGRWWRQRILRVGQELVQEVGLRGSLNQTFAEGFRKEWGKALSPALCVWDHTPLADWVCFLLKEPVKTKNSVRYYPDDRPSVMDAARVSFRAVRESAKFDVGLLDAEGAKLLRSIREEGDPVG